MSKKWSLFSLVLLLAIVLFGCPAAGSGSPPSPFGTWAMGVITVDGTNFTSGVFTVNANGTFTTSYTIVASPGTQAGTFSPASLPENTDITLTIVSGSGVYPGNGASWFLKYNTLTATTVQAYMDLSANGFEGPFTFVRQ